MRQRPNRSGKLAKKRGRTAGTPKSRDASNGVRHRSSEITSETELARLIRERDEAQEQQAATAEVLKVISRSTFDLQTVLDMLTKWAVQLCAADRGIIGMQDGDRYRVRAIYGHSQKAERYALGYLLTPPDRGGVTSRVALEGKAVHIPDVLADPKYTTIDNYRTALGVPLLREGTTIGVFTLVRNKVNPFTDKQIELVTTFADQAVIAIENTRLLNKIRKASDELEMKVQERTAELRRSEAKFRDYAETTSDWFWEMGPDYKFTLLTEENAFGSNPAHRIGTVCWEHALDVETEPEKWRLLRATLNSRKPFRDFVYCAAGSNDSPMYVKTSGKPVFDVNGEFRGYRGTGTDVTAIMRAQEENERLRQLESDLAHMNRLSMMGEFAASLAHEITQPIATARNNARAAIIFLDKPPPKLSRVREALTCVVGDTDRAGQIVDRMLDHLKKAPPRRDKFDLNEAVREVLLLVHSEISKNRVSLEARLTEGLVGIYGDRVQLQQVIMNLILNAIEAMSSVEAGERKLVISTQHVQPDSIGLGVHDSGPGIDPECLDRVFDAFYTTKSKGVGMGLAICRSIIQAHGGRLWAGANEPRGAVFQFTLPIPQNQLMDSLPAAEQLGARREGSEVDALHQWACEGNKRRRLSGPERAPDHSDRP